ncbi:MAG: sigma-70 family RNA polymerase sigma factor [Planctomycetota bacterium]
MDTMSVTELLAVVSAGDEQARAAAKHRLVGLAIDHMRTVAHRMLRGFPAVRRWEQTDDIVQGAALRFVRALEEVVPQDAGHLIRLMAMQVRRELLDLARKYGAERSFSRQHETNAFADQSGIMKVEAAMDTDDSRDGTLVLWTDFHAAADALPEEERELFHLVWYLGMTQEEAAKVIGCSVRTVARRWELTKRHLLNRLPGAPPI